MDLDFVFEPVEHLFQQAMAARRQQHSPQQQRQWRRRRSHDEEDGEEELEEGALVFGGRLSRGAWDGEVARVLRAQMCVPPATRGEGSGDPLFRGTEFLTSAVALRRAVLLMLHRCFSAAMTATGREGYVLRCRTIAQVNLLVDVFCNTSLTHAAPTVPAASRLSIAALAALSPAAPLPQPLTAAAATSGSKISTPERKLPGQAAAEAMVAAAAKVVSPLPSPGDLAAATSAVMAKVVAGTGNGGSIWSWSPSTATAEPAVQNDSTPPVADIPGGSDKENAVKCEDGAAEEDKEEHIVEHDGAGHGHGDGNGGKDTEAGPPPSTATPSAATPSAATPSAATPSTAAPSAATPSAATPSAATPSAATPSTAPAPTAPDRVPAADPSMHFWVMLPNGREARVDRRTVRHTQLSLYRSGPRRPTPVAAATNTSAVPLQFSAQAFARHLVVESLQCFLLDLTPARSRKRTVSYAETFVSMRSDSDQADDGFVVDGIGLSADEPGDMFGQLQSDADSTPLPEEEGDAAVDERRGRLLVALMAYNRPHGMPWDDVIQACLPSFLRYTVCEMLSVRALCSEIGDLLDRVTSAASKVATESNREAKHSRNDTGGSSAIGGDGGGDDDADSEEHRREMKVQTKVAESIIRFLTELRAESDMWVERCRSADVLVNLEISPDLRRALHGEKYSSPEQFMAIFESNYAHVLRDAGINLPVLPVSKRDVTQAEKDVARELTVVQGRQTNGAALRAQLAQVVTQVLRQAFMGSGQEVLGGEDEERTIATALAAVAHAVVSSVIVHASRTSAAGDAFFVVQDLFGSEDESTVLSPGAHNTQTPRTTPPKGSKRSSSPSSGGGGRHWTSVKVRAVSSGANDGAGREQDTAQWDEHGGELDIRVSVTEVLHLFQAEDVHGDMANALPVMTFHTAILSHVVIPLEDASVSAPGGMSSLPSSSSSSSSLSSSLSLRRDSGSKSRRKSGGKGNTSRQPCLCAVCTTVKRQLQRRSVGRCPHIASMLQRIGCPLISRRLHLAPRLPDWYRAATAKHELEEQEQERREEQRRAARQRRGLQWR